MFVSLGVRVAPHDIPETLRLSSKDVNSRGVRKQDSPRDRARLADEHLFLETDVEEEEKEEQKGRKGICEERVVSRCEVRGREGKK